MQDLTPYIGRNVHVKIDRPLGSKHPKFDWKYPVNYGFVPGTVSGDGKEIDVYLLGVADPIEEFIGTCIAVIHREDDDDDDKLIVVPEGNDLSDDEIEKMVHFQEQYFDSKVVRV